MKFSAFVLLVLLLSSCGQEDLLPVVTSCDLVSIRSLDNNKYQLVGINTAINAFVFHADTVHIPGANLSNGLAKNRPDSLFYLLTKPPQDSIRILTMTMDSGTIVQELIITPQATYFGLEYDPLQDLFYAVRVEDEKHLVRIDATTGEAVQLTSDPLDFEFLAAGNNTAFIPEYDTYALLASTGSGLKLITVSVVDGSILNAFPLEKEFLQMRPVPGSEKVYALIAEDPLNHSLGSLNILTGETEVIAEKIFFGQPHGVDYDAAQQYFSILFYSGKSSLLVWSVPDSSMHKQFSNEKLGLLSLDYR